MVPPETPIGISVDAVQRQHYAVEMLGHMSNLFQCRDGLNREQYSTHFRLCLIALSTFRDLSYCASLPPGSVDHIELGGRGWDRLCRVSLGVASHVMGGRERGVTSAGWSDSLGSYLLGSLLEVWLRSVPYLVQESGVGLGQDGLGQEQAEEGEGAESRDRLWRMFVDLMSDKCLVTVPAVQQFHAASIAMTGSVVEKILWPCFSRQDGKKTEQRCAVADIVWPHASLQTTSLPPMDVSSLVHVWSCFHQCVALPPTSRSSELGASLVSVVSDSVDLCLSTRDGLALMNVEFQEAEKKWCSRHGGGRRLLMTSIHSRTGKVVGMVPCLVRNLSSFCSILLILLTTLCLLFVQYL
jgi:hypothetical protein